MDKGCSFRQIVALDDAVGAWQRKDGTFLVFALSSRLHMTRRSLLLASGCRSRLALGLAKE
jgi:hypothetical protein